MQGEAKEDRDTGLQAAADERFVAALDRLQDLRKANHRGHAAQPKRGMPGGGGRVGGNAPGS